MHPPLQHNAEPLRILFLGQDWPGSTAVDRVGALRRLGHELTVVDPGSLARLGPISGRVNHRTGFRLSRRKVAREVTRRLGAAVFDLVWVDGGPTVGPSLVHALRERSRYVLNYNIDDPFGGRDGRHWDTYLQSVPAYDLVVVMRECNVEEAYATGARDVLRVWRTYDEVAHRPRPLSPEESAQWHTKVAFVGTWMPERGPFLADLLRRDVPLTVFGTRWTRAADRRLLVPVVRPPAWGEDYARAIIGADVCLGLLSKGNRDLHTTRSMEIPALGGLLCAERTSEHALLYRDGVDAVLWSDSEECAAKCCEMLNNPELASSIARAGQMRVRQLGLGNEDMANAVLQHTGLLRADHLRE